jgi:hypothetical protein
MKMFAFGFAAASLLWIAVVYVQSTGAIRLFGSGAEDVDAGATAEATSMRPPSEMGAKASPKKKRTGKKRRHNRSSGPFLAQEGYDTSEGLAGDPLGAPGARELAMGRAGGEDQLSEAEIDRGIDGVFRGIERCLVLLPPGAPATGKLVVGMHIASSGQVTKVNLKGPNQMIRGEVGACFQRIVKSIRFRRFDGPDMIAHYPIVFD